jgi:two-component system response regulator FlrC
MSRAARILVADDEHTMRELFRETLAPTSELRLTSDGDEAWELLRRAPFDLAFLDLRLPGRDGAELVRCLREAGDPTPTVVMSAYAGEQRRREILEGGADRFLEKPLGPDAIEQAVRELLPAAAERAFVARDATMQRILAIVARVAPTRATVLLTGETGSGKEVVAREIHRRSHRASAPFVRVNCAALAEGLLESELFGHERGSFTGAVRTTRGLFQAAHGGTLLLDEISEISPGLQAKLLRALQEREVRRVGGARPIAVDARIVATTNRDLSADVRTDRFRADLYHRLNVVRIEVPPLRERPDDLAALTDEIVVRKVREHGTRMPRVAPEIRRALAAHTWPGNVRELENALERAILLCRDGVLRTADLALEAAQPARSPVPVGTSLRDAERALVLETLRFTRGNRTRAAEILGISTRTVRNKIRELRAAGHRIDD